MKEVPRSTVSRRVVLWATFVLFMTPLTSPAAPAPTLANIPYGSDPKQVLDFWKAPSAQPAPLVFFIHGGGWLSSDKSGLDLTYGIERYQAEGISVVSIDYRYLKQTFVTNDQMPRRSYTPQEVATQDPPVAVPLRDAARALQFVRSKAAEWNIDKKRIGLSGGSAGGCSSLWLAFHRDMADPSNPDPVARESTRPWCAAVDAAQTTLDPEQMKQWTPNSRYGGHAFGFYWNPKNTQEEFDQFLEHRGEVLPWIEQYSPYSLLTADAPPVYLYYQDAPACGQDRVDPTHTANFGAILAEKAKRLDVSCEFNYPGAPGITHKTIGDYLIDKLKAADPR